MTSDVDKDEDLRMITGFSYFGISNPELAVNDFRRMREHHANAVLLTLSEYELEFNLENVRELVARARGEGLLVYLNPWGVGNVFGGEPYSALALKHSDQLQIDDRGDTAPAICPNSPVFHDYLKSWIEATAICGPDIVMWDEPHFFLYHWYDEFASRSDRTTCYCARCRALYAEQYGREMPAPPDDSVFEFRHRSLLKLLDWVSAEVRLAGMRNSVCILPPSLNWNGGIRNAEDVFQLRAMDIVGTDPYWQDETEPAKVEEAYRQNASLLAGLARKYGKEAEMWVQNFRIARGDESLVEVATHTSYRSGIRRILAWSFYGSAYMSYIRCERPQAVFEAQSRAFAWCREQEESAAEPADTGNLKNVRGE